MILYTVCRVEVGPKTSIGEEEGEDITLRKLSSFFDKEQQAIDFIGGRPSTEGYVILPIRYGSM